MSLSCVSRSRPGIGRRAVAEAIAGVRVKDWPQFCLGFVLVKTNVVSDSLHQPAGVTLRPRIGLDNVRQFVDHHAIVVGIFLIQSAAMVMVFPDV